MKRKISTSNTDTRGRVRRRVTQKKLSTRTMTVRFVGGPLHGRTQKVSVSTTHIDVGVIPFWTYVRTQKHAGQDGAVTFMKLPTERWKRRLLPRVKK